MNSSPTVEALTQRIKHPFLGPISLFLLFWNWRIVLIVVFGTAEGEISRISAIESLLAQGNYFFWCPFLFGALFCVAMPIFDAFVGHRYWVWFEYRKALSKQETSLSLDDLFKAHGDLYPVLVTTKNLAAFVSGHMSRLAGALQAVGGSGDPSNLKKLVECSQSVLKEVNEITRFIQDIRTPDGIKTLEKTDLQTVSSRYLQLRKGRGFMSWMLQKW
jgi:hypothetical protein